MKAWTPRLTQPVELRGLAEKMIVLTIPIEEVASKKRRHQTGAQSVRVINPIRTGRLAAKKMNEIFAITQN
jgi:hypothetical protein